MRLAMMSDYTLTAQDRCDERGCGARAYVRAIVSLELADLLWCAHHGRKHEPVLRSKCVDWVDETANILA